MVNSHSFRGFKVNKNQNRFFINQRKYISDMLKKFLFSDCNPAKTPISPALKIFVDSSRTNMNPSI